MLDYQADLDWKSSSFTLLRYIFIDMILSRQATGKKKTCPKLRSFFNNQAWSLIFGAKAVIKIDSWKQITYMTGPVIRYTCQRFSYNLLLLFFSAPVTTMPPPYRVHPILTCPQTTPVCRPVHLLLPTLHPRLLHLLLLTFPALLLVFSLLATLATHQPPVPTLVPLAAAVDTPLDTR